MNCAGVRSSEDLILDIASVLIPAQIEHRPATEPHLRMAWVGHRDLEGNPVRLINRLQKRDQLGVPHWRANLVAMLLPRLVQLGAERLGVIKLLQFRPAAGERRRVGLLVLIENRPPGDRAEHLKAAALETDNLHGGSVLLTGTLVAMSRKEAARRANHGSGWQSRCPTTSGCGGSAALQAVVAGAEPAERAAVALLLDRLALVGGAAEAIVAGAVEAKRAAVAALLDRAAGGGIAAGNAVIAGAHIAQRAGPVARQWPDRLLGL